MRPQTLVITALFLFATALFGGDVYTATMPNGTPFIGNVIDHLPEGLKIERIPLERAKMVVVPLPGLDDNYQSSRLSVPLMQIAYVPSKPEPKWEPQPGNAMYRAPEKQSSSPSQESVSEDLPKSSIPSLGDPLGFSAYMPASGKGRYHSQTDCSKNDGALLVQIKTLDQFKALGACKNCAHKLDQNLISEAKSKISAARLASNDI